MRINQYDRLESFLQVAREQGVFDSRGSFTLDKHRAAGKLASFLLPPGGYWILKVVQAACLAQAVSMEVLDTSRTLVVTIDFETDSEHNLLIKSLLEPDFNFRWWSHLSQALRALGLGENRAWVATLESAERTTELAAAHGDLSSKMHEFGGLSGPGSRLTITTESTPQGPNCETNLLYSRALSSSVPLTVNRERIDHLKFAREANVESFPVGVHWVISPSRNGLVIPPGVRDTRTWNYVPAFTVNSRVNRMIAVHYNYWPAIKFREIRGSPVSSSLSLVRHGVIVKTFTLQFHHPVSVDLFLFADDDQVDLSGLRAQWSPTLVDKAEEEVSAFSGSLRDLARQMQDRRWKPEGQKVWTWCGIGAASLLLSPFLPPVVGIGAFSWYLQEARWNSRLRLRVGESLESFRRELPVVIRRS